MFQFYTPIRCKLHFYTKCTAQARAQARVGPKLVVFLHLVLALLFVHADHFINDCAYGSIGFIILDMSCECIFYVCMLRLLLSATL